MYALLSRRDRRRAVVVLVLMLATACFALIGVGSILPFLTLAMDPTAVQRSSTLNWIYARSGVETVPDFVMVLGVATLTLIVIMNVIAALALWIEMRFINGATHSISVRLLEQYLSRPYDFFLTQNTTDLSKNVLSEVDQLVGGVLRSGTVLLSRGLLATALIALLLIIQPLITLVALGALGILHAIGYSAIHRRLNVLGKKRLETNTARYKFVAEAFGGLKEVKTLGREAFFIRQYEGVSKENSDYVTASRVYPRLPLFLIESLAFGGFMAGVLVLMASGRSMADVIPILGLFAIAATRLLPGFQEILSSLASFRFNEHLLQKFYCDLVETRVEPITSRAAGPQPPLAFERRIKLEQVGFRYEGTDRNVIGDLTLEVRKNSSLALVGTTGAGKTTLVDLFLGLLVPTSGRILVDDTPLGVDNVLAWRRKIGYVPQDVFLTDDTIKRNIAFGLDDAQIDRAAVEKAASIAHIHDFIVKELPEGYATVVGERGVRLSGGQRQRLGIARALYHDPQLLVLDEATSDIDNITEGYITEAIQNLAGKKTLLIVAHRLRTVTNCDRICVLDDGGIIASGTFNELASTNSVFQQMLRGVRREPASAVG